MIHLPVTKIAITAASSALSVVGISIVAQSTMPVDVEHYALMKWAVGGLLTLVGGMGALIWHNLGQRVDRIGKRFEDFAQESAEDRAFLHERVHDIELGCRYRHPEEKGP